MNNNYAREAGTYLGFLKTLPLTLQLKGLLKDDAIDQVKVLVEEAIKRAQAESKAK